MRFTLLCSAAVLSIFAAACAATPAPVTPSAPAPAAAVPEAAAAPGAIKAPGEAKIGDTSTCPVSGEEFVVSAQSPKVEFEGKTYYMCCSGCEKKFQADPKKYLSRQPKG